MTIPICYYSACVTIVADSVIQFEALSDKLFNYNPLQVRALLHNHMSALEERKRDLLQHVDVVRQAKCGVLDAQRADLRHRLGLLRVAIDKTSNAGTNTFDTQQPPHAVVRTLVSLVITSS